MNAEATACSTKYTERVKLGARIISILFHPFVIPLYAVLMLLYGNTFISIFPARVKLYIIIATVMCTMVLPAVLISLASKLGMISSLSLDSRKDRAVPMLILAICYVLCSYTLSSHLVLQIINQVILGGLIAMGVCFVVTLFWKISLHMTAIGGLVGLMISVNLLRLGYMPFTLSLLFFAAGLLGSSRLYLGKHNVWQVLAGFLTGFITMFLIMRF